MVDAKKPAAKISIYPVHATIWRNGKFFSVNLERTYKDAEGNWKRANSFDGHHLLTVAKVADMAHTEIERLRAQDRLTAGAENGPEPIDENEGE